MTFIRRRFTNVIETYVTTISKMLHRAGLALLLRLLQLARDNLPIPDLYNQNSTYWKNWLKLDDDLYASDDPAWVAFKAATGEIDCTNVHDKLGRSDYDGFSNHQTDQVNGSVLRWLAALGSRVRQRHPASSQPDWRDLPI
jgi:hypothetical protein